MKIQTISADRTHAYFPHDDPTLVNRAIVLLWGKEVFEVVTANATEGWIERHKRDAQGRLIQINGELQIERTSGKVEILESKHGQKRQ